MFHWDEDGLTSAVKLSQAVEPSNPQKGCKANVKWGEVYVVSVVSSSSVTRSPIDFPAFPRE